MTTIHPKRQSPVETTGPFGLFQIAVLKDITVAALGADWWHMG